MTVNVAREAVAIPTIPAPRQPEPSALPTIDAVPESTAGVRAREVGEYPWPEPWHYSLGARPRSEFWDVATASWHSSGPYPERFSER